LEVRRVVDAAAGDRHDVVDVFGGFAAGAAAVLIAGEYLRA